jgi:thiamine-monophosphate kinase
LHSAKIGSVKVVQTNVIPLQMTSESAFIELMRGIATGPAARGLNDDVAVLEIGGSSIILTQDMMAENVHWLPGADAYDVAWKLVSVNLSDLAAKGAQPLGVMLSFMLGADDWDSGFAAGLSAALKHYDVPLLGGDTVSNPDGNRSISLTAIGAATHIPIPSRSGAKPGDGVFVTGTLGDAKAGFDVIQSGDEGFDELRAAFNKSNALLDEGRMLAPFVTAMMDISDGLLIDAQRMAEASKVAIAIDIANVPLSQSYSALYGDNHDMRIMASSWGDDYQLLFTAPVDAVLPVMATKVGQVSVGSGLSLHDGNSPISLPKQLGYQHSA